MAKVQQWQQLATVMRDRDAHLRRSWRKGTTEATRILWMVSRDNMQTDIYGHPPDSQTHRRAVTKRATSRGRAFELKKRKSSPLRRKGGKGFKWTQTGHLLKGEQMRVRDDFTGVVLNSVPYAHARHNLALDAGDPDIIPPAPKKDRKSWRRAPYRAMAIRETRERRLAAYRKHLQAALQRRS